MVCWPLGRQFGTMQFGAIFGSSSLKQEFEKTFKKMELLETFQEIIGREHSKERREREKWYQF